MIVKQASQDSKGNPIVIEVEVPDETVNVVWHIDRPFRVSVPNDTWRDWFAKKRDHSDYFDMTGKLLYPDLMALLEVVKSIDNSNIVKDEQNTYVYLDEVFDYHLPIISKYNAIVETKPTV